MSTQKNTHYDEDYFRWQTTIGEFGGWANLSKFSAHIQSTDTVLDFGCGGGYLLKNIHCAKKLGIELNPSAAKTAKANGVQVYKKTGLVPKASVDVIISNHALEHTTAPLQELKDLHKALRKGGKIIFVVPAEQIAYKYVAQDINQHLYTWSPMALGNLFTTAGFSLIESKAYPGCWPPAHRKIANFFGRRIFEFSCRLWGLYDNKVTQVRAIALKN